MQGTTVRGTMPARTIVPETTTLRIGRMQETTTGQRRTAVTAGRHRQATLARWAAISRAAMRGPIPIAGSRAWAHAAVVGVQLRRRVRQVAAPASGGRSDEEGRPVPRYGCGGRPVQPRPRQARRALLHRERPP